MEDASLKQSLESRLLGLVDIPSVSHDEAAITDYVRNTIPASFAICHDNDTVLLATPPAYDESKPLVLLAGHTDTVPIVDNVPGKVNKGVVYGRGTADMKAGVAVALEVAHWWSTLSDERRNECPMQPGLLFFGREEVGPEYNPLTPLLQDSRVALSASLAVLMEPTNNALQLGCSGNLNVSVTFHGTSAHSARPWLGDNAISKAVLSLGELAARVPVEVVVEDHSFWETATMTGITGGLAGNVVPPTATVLVNVRYPPSRAPEEVANEWVKRFPDATVEVTGNAPPAPVHGDHPLIRHLATAGATKIEPKQAWTNVADFAKHHVPAVNFGPGDPAKAHTDDECVEIDTLVESARTLQRFFTLPTTR